MRKDSDVCKIAILDNTAVFVKCQCSFEEKKLSFCASGVLSSVFCILQTNQSELFLGTDSCGICNTQ